MGSSGKGKVFSIWTFEIEPKGIYLTWMDGHLSLRPARISKTDHAKEV